PSHSITVSEPGMYFVEVDYGTVCSGSANTLSNSITIVSGESLGIAVQGEKSLELCPGTEHVLEANLATGGLYYTWYKDGQAVSGPTLDASTFTVVTDQAGFEGEYAVEISGSGVCKERSAPIYINPMGSFEVSLETAENIVLLPSQRKTLSVSTTAISPTYQWYKDGTALSGATQASLEVAGIGNYYVKVDETGGPCDTAPLASATTTVVAPESFELKIDFVGGYAPCENTEATLNLSAIVALGQGGTKTDVTEDLKSVFTYQWKKDGQALPGETSKTLSVASHEKNGSYTLSGSVDAFQATSNAQKVKLSSDLTVSLAANHQLLCEGGEPIVLTSSLDLTGLGFEWKKDGKTIDSASKSLTVSQIGT